MKAGTVSLFVMTVSLFVMTVSKECLLDKRMA